MYSAIVDCYVELLQAFLPFAVVFGFGNLAVSVIPPAGVVPSANAKAGTIKRNVVKAKTFFFIIFRLSDAQPIIFN